MTRIKQTGPSVLIVALINVRARESDLSDFNERSGTNVSVPK